MEAINWVTNADYTLNIGSFNSTVPVFTITETKTPVSRLWQQDADGTLKVAGKIEVTGASTVNTYQSTTPSTAPPISYDWEW